jgi:23S rRNA (adenine2503-C2)-methyltransferase
VNKLNRSEVTVEGLTDLRSLTLEETEALAESLGQKKYRGRQLFSWIYRGKTSFREMTDLPEVFISRLFDTCVIGKLEMLRRQVSSDGTEKFLFGLEDGNAVESVFMRYNYGNTVCVSSQAGCRMGCAFCASGINGLVRDLTAGEIVSEVLDIEKTVKERVSRIVVMGTGEPFDNYDNVVKAIRILHDEKGKNISMRNITVSTCGVVPGIDRFADDLPETGLAVSLHAPEDALRSSLMPINRRYRLDELMEACRRYTEKTGRRITFEYALIKGVNDGDTQLRQLTDLLRGMLCHVNLITLNEVNETKFKSAGRARAREFMDHLEAHGVPATLRRSLGADISGACGQLRLECEN